MMARLSSGFHPGHATLAVMMMRSDYIFVYLFFLPICGGQMWALGSGHCQASIIDRLDYLRTLAQWFYFFTNSSRLP